jgi:hypothetical protein
VAASGMTFIQHLLKINELVQKLKFEQKDIRPAQMKRCVCVCVCVRVCSYTQNHPHPPMSARTHTHTHARTRTHTHTRLRMTMQANFFYLSKEKQAKNKPILFKILAANCRTVYVIQEYRTDFSQFLLPLLSIINNFRNICLNKFLKI